MFNNKLRKEHLLLIAECKQMAGQALRLSAGYVEVFEDKESAEKADSLKDVIEELNAYEIYLDQNDYLPTDIGGSYIRLHGVLSSEVSEIDAGKSAFKKHFDHNEAASNNSQGVKAYTAKERKELLLKVCFIVAFALCMYFFFYSKL
ncbi:hypothetical protein [Colwellia piezophila]|uniref:hypothetical protein n=1 Tax=Colwellia piezophila TaxID=211668 RepID=UPI00036FE295|nr:hypothetical protein [Colwellia piezophila]